MSKIITYLVDTHSKAERQEIVNHISKDVLTVSVIGSVDGEQLLAITTGDVWFIRLTSLEHIKHSFCYHYQTIEDFFSDYEREIKHYGGKKPKD